MFGWRRRRIEADAPVAAAQTFDVSIDFDPARLGVSAERVREEVQALPGAGWVSAEPHAGAELDVRVFEAGSGFEAAGTAWDVLRREIERVIASLRIDSGWAEAAPLRAGFAEAALGFGESSTALAQLSALAAAVSRQEREPPPLAPAAVTARSKELEPAEGDVVRLSRLLALVLPVDGRETAEAAIRRFSSFAAVLAAPEAELRRVAGLGTHCVAAIKLIHAAAIRHARAGIAGRPILSDRRRLADYLAVALARERIEQFRILFLDGNGLLQADEVQARGTVNHTPVYPREVVRRALALGARSLILVHNHPTGDPTPSREDVEMTRQVQLAAGVMQIELQDHVIVGNGRWVSFRDDGLLQRADDADRASSN